MRDDLDWRRNGLNHSKNTGIDQIKKLINGSTLDPKLGFKGDLGFEPQPSSSSSTRAPTLLLHPWPPSSTSSATSSSSRPPPWPCVRLGRAFSNSRSRSRVDLDQVVALIFALILCVIQSISPPIKIISHVLRLNR